MIKSIEFQNFRNISGKFEFKNMVSVIIGKNNSGKSNLLAGIKLAFSAISNDYYKITQEDFKDSNDAKNININVELDSGAIPSLDCYDQTGKKKCGFQLIVKKTQRGKYVREISMINGSNVDFDILREDINIPNIFSVPLMRIDEIYTNGFVTGISKFIDSEEKYIRLRQDSKNQIKSAMNTKVKVFQDFCKKFKQDLDIELTDPKLTDEKVYIIEKNQNERNYNIGSGYKSIANIILNTLNDEYNIILIDEIENHLHPSLIRTLIRELKKIEKTQIICTTHSAVVINEFKIEELIDINYKKITLSESNTKKLNIFMHPGRNELLLAENIVLVEGYSEEMIMKNYISINNLNWTIINVAGIMFEPYIEIAVSLKKKIVVVSDNDKSLSDKLEPSARFSNLKQYCESNNVKLLEVENTLETDLYNNEFLSTCMDLLKKHSKHESIFIAKSKMKTQIAEKLIENNVDLSTWHIIEDLKNEFSNN